MRLSVVAIFDQVVGTLTAEEEVEELQTDSLANGCTC